MIRNTARLPMQPTAVWQLTAAAVLVAIIGVGAGQARAQSAAPKADPAAQAEHGPHHAAHHHAAHHHARGGMGMPGAMIPERALDAVGATAEQKAKLQAIFKSARDDMQSQRAGGDTLRQQMLTLMAAPQVDAAAAEALRQQQLARHDVASKRALQAMLDAQAVLTPEQRQKLAERMASRQGAGDRQRHDRHPHDRQPNDRQPNDRRPADAPRS